MNNAQQEQHSPKCPALTYGKLVSPHNCRCDGFHTFEELYEHRHALFKSLCRLVHKYEDEEDTRVWKSKYHSDGTNYDGWFILGINKEKGYQITYHLPEKYWDEMFNIQTLEQAPEFDGHSSEDVIKRINAI